MPRVSVNIACFDIPFLVGHIIMICRAIFFSSFKCCIFALQMVIVKKLKIRNM